MILRWFLSKTVRQAVDLRKQALKILNHQRDILPPKAIMAVETACAELRKAIRSGAKGEELKRAVNTCEEAANKWLKTYPNASLRENVEVVLVAVAVAMAIRTFFLQPFKIPTGSMQPTLWGITSDPDFSRQAGFAEDRDPQRDFVVPNTLQRFADFWFKGVQYKQQIAGADGELREIRKPFRLLLFNIKQDYVVGSQTYTVWFPTDDFFRRAGLLDVYGQLNPRRFKAGEAIFKIRVLTGDHLFVDRLTYNFRRPKRGEIIVFETSGTNIELVDPRAKDTCYIKRLVGLGGERICIGDDRHLVVDGERLDASTPHFESVYGFDPKLPPRENEYSGHVNGVVAASVRRSGLAPQFPDQKAEFEIRPKHYLAMGDNTLSSSDSRTWGDFPQEKVIGRASFVYWPFNDRFGFGYR